MLRQQTAGVDVKPLRFLDSNTCSFVFTNTSPGKLYEAWSYRQPLADLITSSNFTSFI